MKLVLSDPRTGRTYQTEIPKEKEGSIIGLKIGDSLDGSIAGASGYKLLITGGSDKDGFPMRSDIAGGRKVGAMLAARPGFRPRQKGERRRKTVRGNTFTDRSMQVNTKVTEWGQKSLEELFLSKPKEEKKK